MALPTPLEPPPTRTPLLTGRKWLVEKGWARWFISIVNLFGLFLPSGTPPPTATSPGVPGQIAYDATHIYVCVASNTWVRATLASF